ncbi:hypothetical protein [Ferribacterium limneticum]|uniref:hypothetical protein n=1 Tax=Ferribacterium limneticum TaxID=76259 RepID=UPI001CFBA076|nr:hypothetical protein [Ferribacterium limneticum]UCV19450.1 hypothetical protein KI610_02375 [Ferribacterium limneticum]
MAEQFHGQPEKTAETQILPGCSGKTKNRASNAICNPDKIFILSGLSPEDFEKYARKRSKLFMHNHWADTKPCSVPDNS